MKYLKRCVADLTVLSAFSFSSFSSYVRLAPDLLLVHLALGGNGERLLAEHAQLLLTVSQNRGPTSLWNHGANDVLPTDIVDYIIIGGGIAGASLAYQMTRPGAAGHGKKIVMLEAKDVASGASCVHSYNHYPHQSLTSNPQLAAMVAMSRRRPPAFFPSSIQSPPAARASVAKRRSRLLIANGITFSSRRRFASERV
jgi:hypothetical protein